MAVVSVKRSEASARLRNVAACLSALGIPHDVRGDSIDLDGGFDVRVLTASFRSEVGQLLAFLWADEVSRWLDDASGANPASEVLSSLKPSLATVPEGRIFLCSTPLGNSDYHAQQYDLGETDGQSTAFLAPSWECNPQLTEAACRALESDDKRFQREYCGIPQEGETSAFDAAAISAAFRALPEGCNYEEAVGILDPSSGGKDEFCWGIAGYIVPPRPDRYLQELVTCPCDRFNGHGDFTPKGAPLFWRDQRDAEGKLLENPEWRRPRPPVLVIHGIAGAAAFYGDMGADELFDTIAAHFNGAGVARIYSDQRERLALSSAFGLRRFAFRDLAWSNSNKAEAVLRLRRLLSERQVILPDDEKLKNQLLNFSERITASGTIRYAARGSGHDDRVAILLTALIAEAEFGLPGSPIAGPSYRIVDENR